MPCKEKKSKVWIPKENKLTQQKTQNEDNIWSKVLLERMSVDAQMFSHETVCSKSRVLIVPPKAKDLLAYVVKVVRPGSGNKQIDGISYCNRR